MRPSFAIRSLNRVPSLAHRFFHEARGLGLVEAAAWPLFSLSGGGGINIRGIEFGKKQMTQTPKRIYIETTALIQLGQRLENVDFERLLQLKDSAGFRIYISEVSLLEFVRKRKKDLNNFTTACSSAQRILENHGRSIPAVGTALEKVNDYLANIDAHYRDRARAIGIEVLPLAPVSIDRLLKMSIECVPPFEQAEDDSKEKGFRDSLILFSILESMKNYPKDPAMVITQDKLLSKALTVQASELGATVIVVSNLEEATTHVARTLTEAEQTRMRQESLDAIEKLNPYRDDISKKIAEIREITDRDLAQGFRWGLEMKEFEQEGLYIRYVRSIRFERVDSAIWKGKDTSTPLILFRCLCGVTLVIPAPYRVTPSTEPRRFKIGETPSTMLSFNLTAGGPTFEQTEERQLPFILYGVAELQKPSRTGENWELVDLKVEKSVPSEEFDALMVAEIGPPESGDRK